MKAFVSISNFPSRIFLQKQYEICTLQMYLFYLETSGGITWFCSENNITTYFLEVHILTNCLRFSVIQFLV